MRRLVLVVATIFLMFGTNAIAAFFLQWNPSSTYTNGNAIETERTIMYDAWSDGAQIADGVTGTEVQLPDQTFGATHSYKVRTRLDDGRVSDNVVATLSNPLDQRLPAQPGAPLSIVDK